MITRIESNIKGGVSQELTSKLVYLVGGNGSGKTSVMDAIRLACTGGVGEWGPRSDGVRGNAFLKRLTEAPELHSTVEFEDKAKNTYKLGRSAKHSKEVEVIFPVSGSLTAMSGSKNKVMDFLAPFLSERPRPGDVGRLARSWQGLTYGQWLVKASASAKRKANDARSQVSGVKGAMEVVSQASNYTHEVHRSLEALLEEREEAQQEYKQLYTGLRTLLEGDLMEELEPIEGMINDYNLLQTPIGIYLDDSMCYLGLKEGDHVHAPTSGAETLMVALAVGLARDELLLEPGLRREIVVLTPDRMLDYDTQRALCYLTNALDVQVIIQTVSPPVVKIMEEFSPQVIHV